MSEKRTITVIGRTDRDAEDETRRGASRVIRKMLVAEGELDAQQLKERINEFLNAMTDIVSGLCNPAKEFCLDTLTVSAEISAKGSVSLLGTGGEVAGKGGLVFTFKRMPEQTPPPVAKA